jgi:predicted  nucleic acid-binding Zn-ribbon protein
MNSKTRSRRTSISVSALIGPIRSAILVARLALSVSIKKHSGEGEPPIFEAVSSSPLDDRYNSGAFAGAGTYFCLACGSQLSTEESEALPSCPHCGAARFRRDSIFEAHQDHSSTTVEFSVPHETQPPSWLRNAREQLARPGHYLALCEDADEIEVFAIERGWTRIGRSVNADVRLDDPSVSRRHALVVAEPGQDLRVLDDRSLNGVFVNGEAVDWGSIEDGDELTIGRYSLYVLTH